MRTQIKPFDSEPFHLIRDNGSKAAQRLVRVHFLWLEWRSVERKSASLNE
jgi:hypothetical protein